MLHVRPEFPLGDFNDVSADAAAFFGLSTTTNDRTANGTFTGDCTNSGHFLKLLYDFPEAPIGERDRTQAYFKLNLFRRNRRQEDPSHLSMQNHANSRF